MVLFTTSVFLSVPFLPTAVGAPAAGAQPDSEVCGVIEVECLGGSEEEHNFVEDFPAEAREFQGQGYHGECLVCVMGGVVVLPEECHTSCNSEEDEDTQLAYRQMLERARVGDVRGVAEAAREIPEYAKVNDDRQSLQLLDCSGRIVANLPLGELHSEVHAILGSAFEE